MRTVYFHGNPGGPAELALLGGEAVRSWIALDRAALPLEPESRIGQLVTSISELGAEGPVRLVGFSAGAHVALQVAARIPAADLTLQLISPAGPLEIGNFLGKMAGATIFRAAMQRPRLFAALAGAQSFCAARLPHLLTHFLFATAQGDDRELKADAQFVGPYRQVLQSCLIGGLPSYKADIEAYVRPWAGLLSEVVQPVTIWQGSADNWSPPEMAQSMAQRLPNVQALHLLARQSHFSTLRTALAAMA